MKMRAKSTQQGQVSIVVAISLIALLGVIGLAIDSGLGYMTKAKLNAAVDSASIAAARAVTQGNTQADQTNSAKQAAQAFFAANYPSSGFLGSTPTLNDPSVTFDQGMVTIDVSAQASVPMTFMRLLGFNLINVSAASESIRKDLDMAFVMDSSGSMASVAKPVKAAAISFLEQFNSTTDRVALIHFSAGAVVDDAIRPVLRGFDRVTMEQHINALNYNGNTNYAEGLWQARNQLNNVILPANRSSLRVIVFFSDGSPNTIASYFKFNSNTPYVTVNKKKIPCTLPAVGGLATNDGTNPGDPAGLYLYDQQFTQAPCFQGDILPYLAANPFPSYYNAHNPADSDFPFNTPRPFTTDMGTNVNLASRNVPEAMASKSRDEGIYVFTLGRGNQVQSVGVDGETGETLLKIMANTPDSIRYNPNQPTGVYCYAATPADLKPCFSKLASAILRISK